VNEQLLFWGLALLAVALLLVVLEVFVPSGGLIAMGATAAAIAGIIMLFRYNITWGLTGVLAVMVLGPAAFGFALRVWPSTPMGRKLLGEKSVEQVETERATAQRERDRMSALLGAEGIAMTDFRPVGVVIIDGERLDALSETGYIRAGSRVRVTVVESNQLKVRPLVA
jgi:membrane-bound ClpP family serine protease